MMNIRGKIFWAIDGLKGGPIRKHFESIKKVNNVNKFNLNTSNDKLEELLNHATETVPYYKTYKSFSKLTDFPIVNKLIYKDNRNRMFSNKYHINDLHIMRTSGSTGTPFKVYQNTDKRKRVQAELIYYNGVLNYNVGELNGFLRVWKGSNQSKLSHIKKNLLPLDVSLLTNNNFDHIQTKLRKKPMSLLLGYATSLDLLSQYIISENINSDNFKINAIVSGAEKLSESARTNIFNAFRVSPVSRYSNQENGLLAQEIIGTTLFELNKASYYFEFLKLNSDEPAGVGELSRIVITDLYNYAMPMIRYDTGDLCTYDIDDIHGHILTSVDGRKRDLIKDTAGNLLSPGVITTKMWKYPEVKQFQFIQTSDKKYKTILNGDQNIINSDAILNDFKEILGEDAVITINFTTSIPLMESGKFQQVRNLNE